MGYANFMYSTENRKDRQPRPIEAYRDKVRACWLGKAIGGTLGMPYEGHDGPHELTFYDPIPTEMVANDDLDLQVLWACVLDEMGDAPRVDRHVLAEAWQNRVNFPWGEYGVCKRNLVQGLKPPLSGAFDNWWHEGMGAAIRSEIWACLAAGDPDLAGQYAYEDACVDHAGDGIWAEVWLARLQALAFVESDRDTLLDTALMTLPIDSAVRRAVNDTRLWWAQDPDWRRVRAKILDHYYDPNFTHCVMNQAFTVLGWLAGGSDFGRSICIATNCGQDTDCTAATVGSLLGILDPGCIPQKWIDPIGQSLVVDHRITNIHPPATIEGFTDLIIDLRDRLAGRAPDAQTFPQDPSYLAYLVEIGFISFNGEHRFCETGWMPFAEEPPPAMPADAKKVYWPTQSRTLTYEDFANEILLMRIPFTLKQAQKLKVCFSATTETRVWLNGAYAFGRDAGGRMMPSPHLAPINTYLYTDLGAGDHELLVAVKRPKPGKAVTMCLDLADAESLQWLTGVLHTQP